MQERRFRFNHNHSHLRLAMVGPRRVVGSDHRDYHRAGGAAAFSPFPLPLSPSLPISSPSPRFPSLSPKLTHATRRSARRRRSSRTSRRRKGLGLRPERSPSRNPRSLDHLHHHRLGRRRRSLPGQRCEGPPQLRRSVEIRLRCTSRSFFPLKRRPLSPAASRQRSFGCTALHPFSLPATPVPTSHFPPSRPRLVVFFSRSPARLCSPFLRRQLFHATSRRPTAPRGDSRSAAADVRGASTLECLPA